MADSRDGVNSRAGVSRVETLGERLAAERVARSPAGTLTKNGHVSKLLRGWDSDEDKLARLAEIMPIMEQVLLGARRGMLVREDAHEVISRSTDTGSVLLNSEGERFDMPTVFGGVPANSVRVVAVGGGNLQVNINGKGWLPVAAGDRYPDETIWTLRVRVTAAASGTAIVRIGAFIGDQSTA